MRIVPVIDVMGGVVVRAVGGRRDEYRPIQSRLTDSTDPVEVAQALLDASGSDELYIADLDAIAGSPTDLGWVEQPVLRCRSVWIDAGIRTATDLRRIPDWPGVIPVCSFETVRNPSLFYQIKDGQLRERVAMSLEWSGGRVVSNLEHRVPETNRWWWLIEGAYHSNCYDVILIDLDAVGTGDGPTTAEYCRGLKHTWPDMRIITGGGIRNRDDIRRLEDAGVDAVLVASALHDGTLSGQF